MTNPWQQPALCGAPAASCVPGPVRVSDSFRGPVTLPEEEEPKLALGKNQSTLGSNRPACSKKMGSARNQSLPPLHAHLPSALDTLLALPFPHRPSQPSSGMIPPHPAEANTLLDRGSVALLSLGSLQPALLAPVDNPVSPHLKCGWSTALAL